MNILIYIYIYIYMLKTSIERASRSAAASSVGWRGGMAGDDEGREEIPPPPPAGSAPPPLSERGALEEAAGCRCESRSLTTEG